MTRIVSLAFVLVGSAAALVADSKSTTAVPVELSRGDASFSGSIAVTVEGSANKAKLSYQGSIRNTSARRIGKVTFCFVGSDASGRQIASGGCVLTLSGMNWDAGASLAYKGEFKNQKFSEGKEAATLTKVAVIIGDLSYLSANSREMKAECDIVWSNAIKVFSESRFHPTVSDKNSFTATFAFDGGISSGYIPGQGFAAQNDAKRFTNAKSGFFSTTWQNFRVDNVSLYLAEDENHTCVGTIKAAYSAFGQPIGGTKGWFTLESNMVLEAGLLEKIDTASAQDADRKLGAAIKELPKSLPPPEEKAPSDLAAQLERLADLHTKGLLSDDEFTAAKAKLLGADK